MIGSYDSAYKTGITLVAGKSTSVDIPFTAHPQPKVTWQFNNQLLPDPVRIKPETTYNHATLNLNKVKVTDAGQYTLTLENPFGKATFAVKVKVQGRLSAWKAYYLKIFKNIF